MAANMRRRRIIYNEDGDTLGGYRRNFYATPMAVDDYVREVFEPLIGTQVDTFVWCCGAVHGLTYESRISGNRLEYRHQTVKKFDSIHCWREWVNLKSFLASGDSPPVFLAQAAHAVGMEAFLSLRMNDAHDAFQPEVYGGQVKKEHPEWLMGDPGATYEEHSMDWWMRRSFDYAHPELRQYVISIVEEMLEFENEGAELDFMSHPFLFKLGEEGKHAPLLTEMVGRLKGMAAERGKLLMVRVPATIARCERIGIDVKRWISEGLVDILSVGRCAAPTTIPTVEWMQAVSGTECQVYPSINTNLSPKHVRTEALRAFAMQHLRDGAHGVYLFNFFIQPFMRDYVALFGADRYGWDALREIGELETLEKRDKLYLIDRIKEETPGAYGYAIPVDLVDLPLELVQDGQRGRVRFRIGDTLEDSGPWQSTLRLEVANLTELDELECMLNGCRLVGGTRSYPYQYGGDIVFPLSAAALKTGANVLEIVVKKRNPYIEPPLIVDKAEISIRYR